MSYIIFDFEAIRDRAVPHEPRADLEWCSQRPAPDMPPELSWVMERRPVDPFPPACHFQIVCGALLFLGKTNSGAVVARARTLSGTEPEIIAAFMEVVRRRIPMVSYGGRNWDLPCVQLRGMRYGIDVSDLFERDYSDRYRGHLHVDLVEHLTNYGATQRMKMVAAARLIGWPGKVSVDGSQVDQMVEEGRLREVEQYCLQDVANEAAILLRLDLARGRLTRDDYQEYATALLRRVDEHSDLEPLRGRIDRELFLYCHEPGKAPPSGFIPDEKEEDVGEGDAADAISAEIAVLSVEPSGSAMEDLDLRNRLGELLNECGVETDGGDFSIPTGRFSLFLVVPPAEGEAVKGAARSAAAALGILARSSYRGPGEEDSRPMGPPEEPIDIASLCMSSSGSTEADLDLHGRVIELLLKHRVETNGCDYPAGALRIFLVVPPGKDEIVVGAVREIVATLGITSRCTYRAPGEAEGKSLDLAVLRIGLSQSPEADLSLRDRMVSRLRESGVEVVHVGEDPYGAMCIMLPAGSWAKTMAERAASLLGVVGRCSYQGPGEAEEPMEEPTSAEPCDDCGGAKTHTPDCGSQTSRAAQLVAELISSGMTPEEIDAECARNCYKSDFGVNPPDWTIEQAREYLALRKRRDEE